MNATLVELEAQVRRELELTAHPTLDWMPNTSGPGGAHVYDVVIAGAGQGGLILAHHLMRDRVRNILVFDKAAYGQEGVWTTYARMPTLRSPKDYTGPDLGLASLTYQAWHEAKYGVASWDALELIPAGHWADYLLWIRAVTEVPVRNEVELTGIAPEQNDLLKVTLKTKAGEEQVYARKLVLATGQDGAGKWLAPSCIENLPRQYWATTADQIDFAALEGKDVAVLGAGASAADNAATALEAGARTVRMFVRRECLQRVQPYRWLTFAGFLRHYCDLDDAWRWRFMSYILGLRESIPQPTYDRVRAYPNFKIVKGGGWEAAEMRDGRVRLETGAGAFDADYLISCVGMDVDFSARLELETFASHIKTWQDAYAPPADEQNERLGRYPYLDGNGAYQELNPGAAPYLRHIYDYTFAATMSFGASGCSINAMKIATPRLAAGITRALFQEDASRHWETLKAFDQTVFEPTATDADD
jgi:cation diffusion facilitator CzcD-associated flavoprotein CzcO